MARPVRTTKKVVDYSQCGNFDDDEDFACVSAPPSKKSRLTNKDQKHKKEKNINSGHPNAKAKKEPPKERLPLDEKLYQRNLEAALVLSVQEPTGEDVCCNSKIFVEVHKKLSEAISLVEGVSQGCTLSAILFDIFIGDV
ncbi:RAD51-associated protein 1-like [Heterodontus francisci]|uniref:RAD51-associated protein 1-like n=1 Tax=Heterodontus francisci TaxID=7792 RepID=UPI00355BEFF9